MLISVTMIGRYCSFSILPGRSLEAAAEQFIMLLRESVDGPMDAPCSTPLASPPLPILFLLLNNSAVSPACAYAVTATIQKPVAQLGEASIVLTCHPIRTVLFFKALDTSEIVATS